MLRMCYCFMISLVVWNVFVKQTGHNNSRIASSVAFSFCSCRFSNSKNSVAFLSSSCCRCSSNCFNTSFTLASASAAALYVFSIPSRSLPITHYKSPHFMHLSIRSRNTDTSFAAGLSKFAISV